MLWKRNNSNTFWEKYLKKHWKPRLFWKKKTFFTTTMKKLDIEETFREKPWKNIWQKTIGKKQKHEKMCFLKEKKNLVKKKPWTKKSVKKKPLKKTPKQLKNRTPLKKSEPLRLKRPKPVQKNEPKPQWKKKEKKTPLKKNKTLPKKFLKKKNFLWKKTKLFEKNSLKKKNLWKKLFEQEQTPLPPKKNMATKTNPSRKKTCKKEKRKLLAKKNKTRCKKKTICKKKKLTPWKKLETKNMQKTHKTTIHLWKKTFRLTEKPSLLQKKLLKETPTSQKNKNKNLTFIAPKKLCFWSKKTEKSLSNILLKQYLSF